MKKEVWISKNNAAYYNCAVHVSGSNVILYAGAYHDCVKVCHDAGYKINQKHVCCQMYLIEYLLLYYKYGGVDSLCEALELFVPKADKDTIYVYLPHIAMFAERNGGTPAIGYWWPRYEVKGRVSALREYLAHLKHQ